MNTLRALRLLLGLWICCYCAFASSALAQDPFFTHFHNNRSLYNPALTGIQGSTMLAAKYKSQWQSNRRSLYDSRYATYEESMPCNSFDYGVFALQDREGSGLLETAMGGVRLAFTQILGDNQNSESSLRGGFGLQWGQKRIDFSRLNFADQLDPKYGLVDRLGNPNPTSFPFPASGGESKTFFAPSLGLAGQWVFSRGDAWKPAYLNAGVAVHNFLELLDEESFGNEESLLQIGTVLGRRYSAFAAFEFYPYNRSGNIASVRPQLFVQSQENLLYWEMGVQAGFNNRFSLGAHYHTSRWDGPERVNTNWLSISTTINGIVNWSERSAGRIDFEFSYSAGVSGVKNRLGSIFEVGVSYHFSFSPLCRLGYGQDSDFTGKRRSHICPRIGPGRRKLYENTWYQNQ